MSRDIDHTPALLFDLDGTLIDSVYQHVLAWHEALERQYRPNVRVFDISALDWPPQSLVKGKKPEQGAVAWICKGTSCLPPIASLAETQRLLDSGR